jgi:predicted DsbA family dithiol-disulfide isomerase
MMLRQDAMMRGRSTFGHLPQAGSVLYDCRTIARGSWTVALHLKIDFVSDVACPWCAIGLFSLQEALQRLDGSVAPEIVLQPFELNPDMGRTGQNIDEHIGQKYGSAPGQLEASRRLLRERAASVGFVINSDSTSRIYNTFDAHRLLYWANSEGRQLALKRALFTANFTDNLDVSDRGVLVAVAVTAGLDADEAREVLTSGRYAEEVRNDEKLWQSRGIHAVPGIVINGKWLISGGQPPEVFEQALRNIAAELAEAPTAS